jgi:hypothetical protein
MAIWAASARNSGEYGYLLPRSTSFPSRDDIALGPCPKISGSSPSNASALPSACHLPTSPRFARPRMHTRTPSTNSNRPITRTTTKTQDRHPPSPKISGARIPAQRSSTPHRVNFFHPENNTSPPPIPPVCHPGTRGTREPTSPYIQLRASIIHLRRNPIMCTIAMVTPHSFHIVPVTTNTSSPYTSPNPPATTSPIRSTIIPTNPCRTLSRLPPQLHETTTIPNALYRTTPRNQPWNTSNMRMPRVRVRELRRERRPDRRGARTSATRRVTRGHRQAGRDRWQRVVRDRH